MAQEYRVSENVRNTFDAVLAVPGVRGVLASVQAENEDSIAEQITIAKTEAPTFREEGRSALMAGKLSGVGLADVTQEENRNVFGFLKGSGAETILLEAHMDTVYPFGTTKEIRCEEGVLYGPGIYDNARGMACLLAALRALKRSGLKTVRTLIAGGTTREEASGSLGGMRDMLDRFPDVSASVSLDGGFLEKLTFRATYNRAMEYTFRASGGHAFNAFGAVPNPVGAAARAVAKMHEIRVPEVPRTTYAASTIHSAEDSGITAIPESCRLTVNFRSDGEHEFKWLAGEIDRVVHEACAEESERWGKEQVRLEEKVLLELPGGTQDEHTPLLEAAYLCGQYVGADPELRYSGNSNSNIPISRGIPAITIGGSRFNCHSHSAGKECFPIKDAYKCPQGVFLLLLMLLGIEGVTEPLPVR